MAQAPDTPDAPRHPDATRRHDPDARRQPGAPRDATLDATPHPDLLAAVVLHTLIRAGPPGTSTERTIESCERDPNSQAERNEIEAAINTLIADGLAERRGAHVRATRAALRADALSF